MTCWREKPVIRSRNALQSTLLWYAKDLPLSPRLKILITMPSIMTDLELQLFNSDAFLGENTKLLQIDFILEEAPGIKKAPIDYAMGLFLFL